MAVHVIGAGLAGCEAAWQCASLGVRVILHEMKKKRRSPAHHYGGFAELVCSNSLKSAAIESAPGLLKEEMRLLNSLIIQCADKTSIPAGGALAVDRDAFSDMITKKIRNHPLITVVDDEYFGEDVKDQSKIIIATGPLTDGILYEKIKELISGEYLYFFDAAAPLIETDSIDMSIAFKASRYGKSTRASTSSNAAGVETSADAGTRASTRASTSSNAAGVETSADAGTRASTRASTAGAAAGEGDYINCPMNKQQYLDFYNALIEAETAKIKDFEDRNIFEGCMPVETMAKRGADTLRFGPLKPVGLDNPVTGERYYAVVQLRQDNSAASLYNMVGFQTRLKFDDQRRVFSMIPGLKKASFVRYGVMHRNTFINSPQLLNSTYKLQNSENIFFAGQITGVEGYAESAASGLIAGLNAALEVLGKPSIIFENDTAIGALAQYISDPSIKKFQPMNINFGIIRSLDERVKDKKVRYSKIAQRALEKIRDSVNLAY